MANYATLKAAIAAAIKENGNNEITGDLLQQQLLAMVNLLGSGYQYIGIANPQTAPGEPDANVFYFASTPGTYVNMDDIVLAENEVAILRYNGTWSKDVPGFATLGGLQNVDKKIGDALGANGDGIIAKKIQNGGFLIGHDGGQITNPSYSGFISKYTDLIPVSPGEKFYFLTQNYYANVDNFCVAFLDSNKTVISRIVQNFNRGPKSYALVITIPENCSYVIFQSTAYTNDENDVDFWVYKFGTPWDDLRKINENIYGIGYDIISNAYLLATGAYNQLSNTTTKVTRAIPCVPGDKFKYNGYSNYSVAGWVIRSGNVVVGSGQYVGETEITIAATYDVGGVTYIPDSIQFSSYGDGSDPNNVILSVIRVGSIYDALNTQTGGNVLVPGTIITQFIDDKYLADSDGSEQIKNPSWPGCACSGFVSVEYGKQYTIVNNSAMFYSIHGYDENQAWVGRIEAYAVDNPIMVNIPKGVKYIRVCWIGDTSWDFDLIKLDYLRVGTYVNYSASQIIDMLLYPEMQNSGNVLFGKKWVACGDSFTQGDFNGLTDETLYKFQDSPYKNRNKVYPYYIGRRNGMTIINEAISGSIMALSKAYIDDPTNVPINTRFPFSYQRYQNIPADADYITLWFGINDAANTYLGTIDDTTNETFYGAWNVVLEYLIRNHPLAKIGIIVTNGTSSTTYKQAVRDVALKWGIPYLDMTKDPQIPPIFERDASLNYSPVAEQIRTEQFRVTSTNGHPNASAHEFESYFIENWLRTL